MSYGLVSVVAFILMLLVPSKQRPVSNVTGTTILAIAWPILLVGLIYFGGKKLITGRGVSARWGEIEAGLCIVAGSVATLAVLYFMGDPTMALLWRTL